MNKEVKEITIKTPGQILDYVDTKEHLLELFNYITNLQQERDKFKSRNEKAIEQIKKDRAKCNYKEKPLEKQSFYCNKTNILLEILGE